MALVFFFNHLYISIIGWVIQTLIMLGHVWFPKFNKQNKEYKNKFIQGLRVIPYGIMFLFGLLFMHVGIAMLSGGYPLVTWAQTLPSTILALVCGSSWILASVFVAPNIKTIITGSATIGITITFLYIVIPLSGSIWNALLIFPMFLAMLALHGLLFTGEQVVKLVKPEWEGDKRLWNLRPWLKRWYTWKFNLALWIIITLEMMAQIAGYSLITVFIG
ncbi:hypothetical protein GF325_16015 [Candidatus Bathyarchaeota archaeon]|nr:hypothetical protein [Candidatus Bathyarchaeota archaeon]